MSEDAAAGEGASPAPPAPGELAASGEREAAPWAVLEVALVVAAAVYLVGPWRHVVGDVSSFVLGALLLWLTKRGVRPEVPADQAARSTRVLLLGTVVVAAAMIGLGVLRGAPVLRPGMFVATLAIYLPFAWVQEYLTQAYLVGRLARRFGGASDLKTAVIGGVAFGLCHIPFPDLVLPTALSGSAWAWFYLRGGRLWPVALSHALLGTCLFLNLLDRDPFRNWNPAAWVPWG